ncbi:MAG: EAL domain-containing protein [Gammaproteobacteria bacterium]|nr:EAL domain-containing protein [Gammaproteobacteria bacterium]
MSEENPLGTADVALHFAKNNNLPFMLYEKDIDNKKELQSNLFWKKEIQCGITSDSFLPVFQPIVDRNGIVQKYESLMRLKKDDGKDVNYIIPIEFLDRAKKMRKYCVISAMTIFKSLEFCKKSGVGITINLDKQDMKNCQFTGKLKEKIIELDIADKIVFEILESENILDNVIIKKFILDFRGIGVKFAIDDFGSGYSNFSFILEIKPDFLKIDGSLVKNITEDRNSYELVKSIVAFAKELDIVTIAEFVHSNEVFITVLDLGVDLFQGYHFDGPKNLIETSPLH